MWWANAASVVPGCDRFRELAGTEIRVGGHHHRATRLGRIRVVAIEFLEFFCCALEAATL